MHKYTFMYKSTTSTHIMCVFWGAHSVDGQHIKVGKIGAAVLGSHVTGEVRAGLHCQGLCLTPFVVGKWVM